MIIAAWVNRFDPVLTELVVKNFPAIIGLPFAFIAAFVVVAPFRQGSAPIEFGGFGVSFKGASGEIILWILCFLAIGQSACFGEASGTVLSQKTPGRGGNTMKLMPTRYGTASMRDGIAILST